MDFASLTPFEGGWSGQTFLAEAAGERHVVRIYAEPGSRGEQAHEVDAALLRLVRGLLPVADVLEVRRGDPATGMPALLRLVRGLLPVAEVLDVRRSDPASGMPALLVTSLLPGERGDLVLPRLDEAQQAVLGREVGALVATLGAMPQLRAGPFVDGDLRIGTFGGAEGLDDWVRQHEPALAHWSVDERAGLLAVAEGAQELLDSVGRHCLVHSDLNPKNFLVDRTTLRITGLVDWEFAHAGHPFTDLGNVLRFDRQPAYVEAVLAAYAERHDTEPTQALHLARAADLWALVDLAARRGQNPVADQAEHLLRAVAAERDRHAWPAVG